MEAKNVAATVCPELLGGGSKPTQDLSNQKRADAISWDEYFMALAILSGHRSKDPNTQVGACIVSPDNKIVATGYNRMPSGCDDDVMPWGKNSDNVLETKRLYVCHAEMNAIMNKCDGDLTRCRIYVPLFPCVECAKLIAQTGIREVIYDSDKYKHKEKYRAARFLLGTAGVKMRQFGPSPRKRVVIDFDALCLSDDDED